MYIQWHVNCFNDYKYFSLRKYFVKLYKLPPFCRWIVKKNESASLRVEFCWNTLLYIRRKNNPFRTATPTFTSYAFKYRYEILMSLARFTLQSEDRRSKDMMSNVRFMMLHISSFLYYNKNSTIKFRKRDNFDIYYVIILNGFP